MKFNKIKRSKNNCDEFNISFKMKLIKMETILKKKFQKLGKPEKERNFKKEESI